MNSTIAGLKYNLNRNSIQMNSTIAGPKETYFNRNNIKMNSTIGGSLNEYLLIT